jgi:DNA repair exonuclease SbcCD nuclease subunit
MKKFRFVHLSDIHFGQETDGSLPIHEDVRRKLVEDCHERAVALGSATGVLITGDVAFSGKPREYSRAGDWMEEITSAVGCKLTSVCVVPGNHDVDIEKIDFPSELVHKELRAASASQVDAILEKIMKSEEAVNPLVQKFVAYKEFAARYECDFDSPKNPSWGKTIDIDGTNSLRFIGFNSAQVSDLSDSIGRMILGSSQYTIYPPTDARKYEFIVLMHHPFSWFIDRHNAEKYLRRARVIMMGHEHNLEIKKITREDESEQLEIYAGATNPKEGEVSYTYRYNWIEFSLEPTEPSRLSITVHPRVWNYDNPHFVADFNRLNGSASATFSLACPNFTILDDSPEEHPDTETVEAPVRDLDVESIEVLDNMSAEDEDFAKLRYFFWKYLNWQKRLEILVELHILPSVASQPVPQTMERLALEAARRENKLRELWDAVMQGVPAEKRQSNPFAGG